MKNYKTNNVAVRETEINRVMSNLSEVVQQLTQSVEATESRLTGVVRNSRTIESKEQGDTPYETILAQNINSVHDKIQSLRERLDDLLNRIEL